MKKSHLHYIKIALLAFAILGTIPIDAFASSGKAKEEKEEKKPKEGEDKKTEGEKKKGEEKNKKEGEDGEEKESISGGRFEGDAVYVHIQPMILPVINESGAQQIVTLLIDLQVNNIDTAKEIQTNMPRIKDSLMQKLYGGFGDGSLLIHNTINIPKLKASIFIAIENVVGRDKINDVLVQALGQRML